jgi:serine/threonine protein kinase
MTLKDPLMFDLPCWKLISDKAQNFISGCLIKDPSKRLTIEQVVKHPWFTTMITTSMKNRPSKKFMQSGNQ